MQDRLLAICATEVEDNVAFFNSRELLSFMRMAVGNPLHCLWALLVNIASIALFIGPDAPSRMIPLDACLAHASMSSRALFMELDAPIGYMPGTCVDVLKDGRLKSNAPRCIGSSEWRASASRQLHNHCMSSWAKQQMLRASLVCSLTSEKSQLCASHRPECTTYQGFVCHQGRDCVSRSKRTRTWCS